MSTPQELRELLDRALQSVVVTHKRDQLDTTYSVPDFRQALLAVRSRYTGDLRLVLALCNLEVRDQKARNGLLAFLRDALHEHIHQDRIQTIEMDLLGGTGSGLELDRLAEKLLELAIALGADAATGIFMRSVVEPQCEFQRFILLDGITMDASVELYDGVRLTTLPQTEAALPPYLPFVHDDRTLARFRGGVLLVEDWSTPQRYMNPEKHWESMTSGVRSPFAPVLKSSEMPEFHAFEFGTALSLVAKSRVGVSFQWSFLPDDDVGKLDRTISRSFGLLPLAQRMHITGQQLQEALRLYESLSVMDSDARARLSVPIDRLIASWNSKGEVDQIIDLAIALESLYLPDSEGELGYRLRIRGARHLEAELSERRELAGRLKAFYKVRSKAVHTGKIPKLHNVGSQQVKTRELIAMTQELCLRSVRQVLDVGFPDWETLELG